jgi:hypothetical protein
MTLPSVNITELDGQLGATSVGGKLLAVAGPCTSGPFNIPSTFARTKDMLAQFTGGPAVEAAAYAIDNYEIPVMLVRSNAAAPATVSAVTSVKVGSAAVTVKSGFAPVDDLELALEILTDGTVGTAGIKYRVSQNAGRSWSETMTQGTGTEIAFPGVGVTLVLGTGTVKAGDLHAVETTAATWNDTNLHDALAPLGVTQVQWKIVHIVGTLDDATIAIADAVKSFTNGKHIWIGNTRVPARGADPETEAEYATDMQILSSAHSSRDASLFAGACRATSAISGKLYRRPAVWGIPALQASVSEEINIADVDLGALPGISIRDANGMPVEHDEAVNPGLDDMRFGTLRTWPRREGVYVNLPRLFSPTGSDFKLIPHRLVMNLAHEALIDYLISILHKPIQVSRKTGFILSAAATRIELGADAVLATVLLAKPKASGAYFKLSRTDNLLSLPALNGGAKVLPLVYPEWINVDLSFENPALQIQAV